MVKLVSWTSELSCEIEEIFEILSDLLKIRIFFKIIISKKKLLI